MGAEPELVIVAPTRDLGNGFQVRRALPSPRRRMVGPFIFFDQMGPVELRSGDEATIEAASPARVLVLGGEPADGPRHIFWNFVSSSRERIEAAKADWRAGRFAKVPGETEFIPLPGDKEPPPVHYP